ncbi:MAG TPA: hypothetical protein VIT67_21460, partial [Povalibacter sp.]
MTAPISGVDTHEQVATLEQFWPRLEWMQVVERDPDALLECPLIFVARREIWREQNVPAVDAGDGLCHVLD